MLKESGYNIRYKPIGGKVMTEPLFLVPELHDKIWGGTELATYFGFDLSSNHVGEAWLISAHPNGLAKIANGEFKNETLLKVWDEHKELFGNATIEKFPLLVKFLDAKTDLSIQVHPDNTYAAEHAHELGKTECWYILASKPEAVIYYGHNAQSKEELIQLVNDHAWDKLLRKVPVKAGDFFYIPAGMVHALGAGVLALEVQQSSDTTYRIYDFNRIDKTTGKKRALHLKDALNVITIPSCKQARVPKVTQIGHNEQTELIDANFFKVVKWQINKQQQVFKQTTSEFTLVVVIAGDGQLIIDNTSYHLSAGQAFVIPSNIEAWVIDGEVTVILSKPKMIK